MKAAYINQTGTHDVITYGDLPTPKPTRRQCLIKVAAVDVNPIDVYIRSGAIPVKLAFPFILGRDLAGTVVEIGASVKDFKVGDRVWATSQGADGRPGTFAEFAAVDYRWLHPIPEGVSDDDAVALSLVGVTAQLGLVRSANLKAGEVLFVNGGSGGIGSCVVQMAKILGRASSPRRAPTRRSRPAGTWGRTWRSITRRRMLRPPSRGLRPTA